MGKLDSEARMTIRHCGLAVCRSPRSPGIWVSPRARCYHVQRQLEGTVDGRSRQEHLALQGAEPITTWLVSSDAETAMNLAALHAYLVEEHAYPGSLRSVERYFRVHFPKPKRRARRRVETPPGAQAQVDWSSTAGCGSPARSARPTASTSS